MIKTNLIYNENCLDTMARMDNSCLDFIITSPPYDGMRDYNGYTFNFERIAYECLRVLKVGGVCVWIVSDSTINGSESGTSFKQALFFKEIGFSLHDTMIWRKPSAPYPSKNRYTQVFENMFILSKGKVGTFHPIKDKENIYAGYNSGLTKTSRGKDGVSRQRNYEYTIKDYGARDNVWDVLFNNRGGTTHPATFSEELVKDHILSWSNEGDLVYDPFSGSGTTAKVAKDLQLSFIGSEISHEYCVDACKRIGCEMVGMSNTANKEAQMTALEEIRKIDAAKDEFLKVYETQRAALVKSAYPDTDRQDNSQKRELKLVRAKNPKPLGEGKSKTTNAQAARRDMLLPRQASPELQCAYKSYKQVVKLLTAYELMIERNATACKAA